jgi:hypothetical protein
VDNGTQGPERLLRSGCKRFARLAGSGRLDARAKGTDGLASASAISSLCLPCCRPAVCSKKCADTHDALRGYDDAH